MEEYVNNTGLMWTLAPKLGALLVFAEHRYEGESFPNVEGIPACMSYCSSAEALADFAALVTTIKTEMQAPNSPVVAFGGSYGGMLSSWFRIKYPNVVDGAIAASAPIWGFPLTYEPVKQPPRLAHHGHTIAITRGVSAAGGATDFCRDNLAAAWPLITEAGKTQEGRALLGEAFRSCHPIKNEFDVRALLDMGQGPWFEMAEGNYPFPSTYITYSVGPGMIPLPAWPMRVACRQGLDTDFGVKFVGNRTDVRYTVSLGSLSVRVNWNNSEVSSAPHNTGHGFSDSALRTEREGLSALVRGVAEAVGVWYNITGKLKCFDLRADQQNQKQQQDLVVVAPQLHTEHHTEPSERPIPVTEPTCAKFNGAQKWSKTECWSGINCNEHIHLVNTAIKGVGNDFFLAAQCASRLGFPHSCRPG